MLIAVLPKFPLVIVFLKLVYIFYGVIMLLNISVLFNVLAISSILLGTYLAIYEVKLKRLIAYSAISHMGYMLLGLNLYIVDGLLL
jgi:NADH-quinone oxidoreductase subunit N